MREGEIEGERNNGPREGCSLQDTYRAVDHWSDKVDFGVERARR